MFEQEVPEIYDGVVEIKSISREAGSRTKMAVYSSNPDVDAIGSCIGNKGARVNKIVEELGGEKIDIVLYSDDPEKYISAALSPASVCKVEITDEETKSCRATVPDGQLSLAIGNKGQNARLAARLTGWRIDIRPESGFYGEDEDDEPKTEEKSEDVLDLDESTEGETNHWHKIGHVIDIFVGVHEISCELWKACVTNNCHDQKSRAALRMFS